MDDKLNNLIKVFRNFNPVFMRAVKVHETEILDANTAQLEIGKDSLGELLYDYATDEYAQWKQSIGSKAPMGTPDLKVTGDFHSAFVIRYKSSEFEITSTDSKTGKLVDMYGEQIFGLNDDAKDKVLPDFTETIIDEIRKMI